MIFKNIDKNINQIVKSVKDGKIDINEVFNDIEKIRVLEFKYNAGEQLFDLFKNATELLEYKGTDFDIEYKVGCRFYDSDSDSDSDTEELDLPYTEIDFEDFFTMLNSTYDSDDSDDF